MNPANEFFQQQNRRQFFQGAGLKMGGIALASMLGQRAWGAQTAEAGTNMGGRLAAAAAPGGGTPASDG